VTVLAPVPKEPQAPAGAPQAPERPDFEAELVDPAGLVVVERPLPWHERVLRHEAVQNGAILVALALVWELYARYLDNPLLLPAFSEVLATFVRDLWSGLLVNRVTTSLKSLTLGYGAGLALAAVFTSVAVSTRIGSGLLTTLTSMFNPLPAIALLPLALIWFGLGTPSLVFVIVHSVLWAVSLNTLVGFRSVPETLRMSGRNVGLRGIRYVALILVPAAFAAILAGMKIGWAFAWRTLIAAELVFGVSSRSGGLGWYIFEARSELETAKVFAGLFAVILIGLFVEAVIFKFIERRTVLRWGMQR
jgi:NitT/TauT family transport system permease protein